MKRLMMLPALACALLFCLTAMTQTASAQQIQWVPQTFGPSMPYTYQQRVYPNGTVTIPYWQAYGSYTQANRGNMGLPLRDTLPARNQWSGIYPTTRPTYSGYSTGSRPTTYRPIQSNPRSSGSSSSKRRVYVKLR